MILIFILGLVALRILYSVGEICYERDWPRSTWKGLLIALGVLCIAVSAFGQAARVDIPLLTSGPSIPITGGPLPQALWVANATAYLCTHPSATLVACQAAPITTYTDSTEGTTCPTATPLVQLPGNTCTAATGTTANVGFWYGGGVFDYWIVSSYGTYGPFSGNSGGVGSGCGVSGACTIAQGGTGATTAAGALANLGGAALAGAAFTGPVSAPSMPLNVLSYGAVGNNVHDDTAAINSALTAGAASGQSVYLPAGSYLLKGSGSCLLNSIASVFGDGWLSALVVDSSVGASTDVLCVAPTATVQGISLKDFSITSNSGTPGRYGINISPSGGGVWKDNIIENVHIVGLGAQALYLGPGTFTDTIRNNYFEGCILLNQAADSLHFENNTITGNCTGISGSFILGASADTITGNNITSLQGMINISLAYNLTIEDNYLENSQSGYVEGDPCLSLGSSHTTGSSAIKIYKNTIACSFVTNTNSISLDNVANVEISQNNTINTAGTGVQVATTALTNNIFMGVNSCSNLQCVIGGAGTNIYTALQQLGNSVVLPSGVSLSVGAGTPVQTVDMEGTTNATSFIRIGNKSVLLGSGYSSGILFTPITAFTGTTEALSGASIKAVTSASYSTGLEFSTFDQSRGTFAPIFTMDSAGDLNNANGTVIPSTALGYEGPPAGYVLTAPTPSTGCFQYTGSAYTWGSCGGSGTFTALSGDATSTSTGGATTVVGIEGHAIAAPSTAGFVHWSGTAWEYTNPSGSGTVNSGTAWSPTYYAATGTAVSGTTPFTGLEYWAGSAAPTAASASQVVAVISTTAVANATAAVTATNTAGGAVGSAPYQSAAGTTAFIASPTTTGHYFVYSWQPTGSAIDPVALDLATWFSAQTYGGTLTSSQVTTALTFTPVAPTVVSLSDLTTAAGGAFGTGAYASAYSLPTATTTVLGGVLLGATGGANVYLGYTPANCTAGTTGSDCLTLSSGLVPAANLPAATPSVAGAVIQIAPTTFTTSTGSVSANTCNSTVQVAMASVTTAMTFVITPSADTSGATGWGSTGGLILDVWPTAGYANIKICNQTAATISSPGAVTFNITAR